MNAAYIKYNIKDERYELFIDGKIKAYTQDNHEKGLEEMKELAEEKGYTVYFEGDE